MGVTENLKTVRDTIAAAAHEVERPEGSVTLVAVSKTFPVDDIRPALAAGQRVFGENRVQEAEAKWPILRQEADGIELHLIGPLQSNKAAEAVALFDVIETVDREKIARALAKEIEKQGRHPKLFVQVNTGNEPQKAGIDPRETTAFLALCRDELKLVIEGLMCIPPVDENPGPHFALLADLARENGLHKLSMGMSSDYQIAVSFGATHVRVGSAIFGHRDYPA
ncbi:YggS family pyridoxal phosphate-dependent enzyme [Martelella alba]|uniref:Pyridoxal phosphate homeostasis protein n=1 Tax=Martelella alba TaxID=2590451 RepID=A0A506U265_9HYPH|nr:YggS family pyridoxal phosphate-dependent enzyme [Martelella alba]TPW28462.1 YggS family pyridoxal phosphate-dependent enzyme [Martelella alba]